jgi:RHS repeat-associated protein
LVNGDNAFKMTEVIYLGHFEIRRTWRQAAQTPQISPEPKSEWHWNRLMEDDHCVCVWGYMTHGDGNTAKPTQLRYQLNNHLGSSTIELNEKGQIITYEEYYPYGGTAFIAAKGKTLELARVEVKSKQYRYSGKELDEATGLCYYGMRYYAPWLGRWLSADPVGAVEGLNLYAFVAGNPTNHKDLKGLVSTKKRGKHWGFVKGRGTGTTKKGLLKHYSATTLRNSGRLIGIKKDYARVHWKGTRKTGKTSGVPVGKPVKRNNGWPARLIRANKALNKKFNNDLFFNSYSRKAAAEKSHALAAAFGAPNDELSGHPASSNQNTVVLAVEAGLMDNPNGQHLRYKATNYVDESTGFLEFSRHKIENKSGVVFDLVVKGNLRQAHVQDLEEIYDTVRSLDQTNGAIKTKSSFSIPTPTLVRNNNKNPKSEANPFFTDLRTYPSGQRLTGIAARTRAKSMYTSY